MLLLIILLHALPFTVFLLFPIPPLTIDLTILLIANFLPNADNLWQLSTTLLIIRNFDPHQVISLALEWAIVTLCWLFVG
jgi:hypothetical protein